MSHQDGQRLGVSNLYQIPDSKSALILNTRILTPTENPSLAKNARLRLPEPPTFPRPRFSLALFRLFTKAPAARRH